MYFFIKSTQSLKILRLKESFHEYSRTLHANVFTPLHDYVIVRAYAEDVVIITITFPHVLTQRVNELLDDDRDQDEEEEDESKCKIHPMHVKYFEPSWTTKNSTTGALSSIHIFSFYSG